ncbi:hypothetical protein RHMOL_Rhmol04G0348000 [Rhododendron molle]|uniref:Uncharacterized protein n=1 Tax=Rhododendron molle TaxID=49168 RepID=A0ACC0P9U6_RHOML|nr:hypothetical protein RHMOL_Rhmol04G0348000 [Rhododendron molle]
MRFSIPMMKSKDILEKDNKGIQEITERERRERTVYSFMVVVEREEAAVAACEDGAKRRRQLCEDEAETCTGEARG